jgi:hypothetical protein
MCETDPVEESEAYKQIENQLNHDIQGALEKDGLPKNSLQIGLIHLFWVYKKQVLREKYGIDWRSPYEMTPHAVFE